MFIAPIDHQLAFHNAMSAHLSEQSGQMSGVMESGTGLTAPVGVPRPIRMKVKPHVMRSKVQDSLSAPNPGSSLARSIIK